MKPVHAATPTAESVETGYGQPQIIFFCGLDGSALLARLKADNLAPYLAAHGYGIAVGITAFDEALTEAIQLLNRHHVPVVAWLLLPDDKEPWFNLRNYPQAFERYHSFREWVRKHGLQFQAVGINIAPPSCAFDQRRRRGPWRLIRRLWRARRNVLYNPARSAYSDLVSTIRYDGYEVHAYQVPLVADDRRAGATLIQRMLDIVDVPADVEVLLCYSSIALAALGDDLDGALIAEYGPAADGIGVGIVEGANIRWGARDVPPLTWDMLERDLLLAGQYTDVIYVSSLEGCLDRGLLPRIAAIDWEAIPSVPIWKRTVTTLARLGLFIGLLFTRFSPALFAWLGWALCALILTRQLRAAIRHRQSP